MVRAGLAEAVIIASIRDLPGRYDLSPDELIRLKEAGVSEGILTAMAGATADGRTGSAKEVTLRDGTELRLRTVRTLSSETARTGDSVEFEVAEDVVVDGIVVIAKGAKARGEVIEAKKRKSFGRSGKLNFTIDVVQAVDGSNIRLRTTKESKGDESYGKAGVVTILAGPFGALVKGKDVTIEAGTEYTIFIDGDRVIQVG